jgi:hypothetical protein
MRVGVYISGGITLFDVIRYAADIIRGVFGVFGFNLDCDFHGSRLLASCCNRVDRRRRTTAPISATARDLFMIPDASRTTGTRCAATQITHGRYATSATTDNATALHQATVPGIPFSGRRDTLFGSTRYPFRVDALSDGERPATGRGCGGRVTIPTRKQSRRYRDQGAVRRPDRPLGCRLPSARAWSLAVRNQWVSLSTNPAA